jgi:hypothetical protein
MSPSRCSVLPCSASNIITAIEPGSVTSTGEIKNAYRIWYGNPKTRDHFEDRRKILKMRIEETECDLTDSVS